MYGCSIRYENQESIFFLQSRWITVHIFPRLFIHIQYKSALDLFFMYIAPKLIYAANIAIKMEEKGADYSQTIDSLVNCIKEGI